jgi:hypothetical protein
VIRPQPSRDGSWLARRLREDRRGHVDDAGERCGRVRREVQEAYRSCCIFLKGSIADMRIIGEIAGGANGDNMHERGPPGIWRMKGALKVTPDFNVS